MKNILTAILFLLVLNSFAQNNGTLLSPINPAFLNAYQSSTVNGKDPSYGIDGIVQTRSETNVDDPSWYWIEMLYNTRINGIQVNSPNLKDYYIFFSKANFVSNDVNELLTDPWVDYIHISESIPDNTIIPVNDIICTYVLIIPPIGDPITLRDVTLFGDGPNDPDGGDPCDFCPEPDTSDEPWFAEECNNGIDDDLDGAIDCNDAACGVGTVSVTIMDPSCPGCNDGRICLRAPNATHFSIDNGISWHAIPSGQFISFCFNDLPAGTYNILAMNEDSGCTSLGSSVILSDGNTNCDNVNFEDDFNHWTGASGDNIGGDISITNNQIGSDTHEIILTNGFVDQNVPELEANHPWLMDKIARIGQTDNGADGAQLTYCFTVDADDPYLTVVYAFVANNPNHNHGNDPFFTWRYHAAGNPNVTILDGLFIDSTTPTLNDSDNGNWVYSPFDCMVDDLSAFVGQEICIELTAAECALGAHQGYAYIDLACGDNRPLPIANELLVTKGDFSCDEPLIFNASGKGEFFNSYNWVISKVDENGVESNPYSTTIENGVNPTLEDIVQFYTDKVGEILSCGDHIKVQLNLYNSCAQNSEFVLVEYPCEIYPIPDIVSINSYEISCDGFEIDVEGNGTDFDTYSWTLSRVTASGNVVSPYTTSVATGQNPTLDDVINLYIDNMGHILKCDEKLEIKLNLFHECGTQNSDIIKVDVPCLTWKAAYPNIFSPNHPNPVNQTFSLTFSAMDYTPNNTPECNIMQNDITTINYFRLQIFDKWGNKVFDEEKYDDSNSFNDLNGSEIVWDGTWDGTPVVPGVYSFLAYVGTCGRTKKCNDCGQNEAFQYCAEGDLDNLEDIDGNPIIVETFADDVTMIL